MYSLNPVADMSQHHEGFYIVVCGVLVCLCFQLVQMWRKRSDGIDTFWTALVLGIFTSITYYNSYSTVPPLNQKVAATFVGYETVRERTQSGKYTNTTDVTYGHFMVNGGNISVRVDAQTPIPQSVYLYKN